MSPEDIAAWKDTGHWHEAFCTGDIIVPTILKQYEVMRQNVLKVWTAEVLDVVSPLVPSSYCR